MRNSLALLLLAFALAGGPAAAQTGTATAQFPTGSRIGLIPPAGMAVSTQMQGFEDTANNAFIRLVELPAEAHSAIEKTLTADGLKQQGMTLDKRDTLAVGAGKGILLSVRQDTPAGTIRKWLLVAPLPGRTAMVSMEFPQDLKTYSEEAIRKAFATVATRDSVPDNEQLALMPFKVGNLAGFRVAGAVPGRAIQLTDGPKDMIGQSDQPHLMIGIVPGGTPKPDDRDTVARNAMSSLPPMKDVRITGSESMRIAGQQGHEMRAEAKDIETGADITIVQWLRFGAGASLRIVGIAPKDGWTKQFMRFREVRDSIEPR